MSSLAGFDPISLGDVSVLVLAVQFRRRPAFLYHSVPVWYAVSARRRLVRIPRHFPHVSVGVQDLAGVRDASLRPWVTFFFLL